MQKTMYRITLILHIISVRQLHLQHEKINYKCDKNLLERLLKNKRQHYNFQISVKTVKRFPLNFFGHRIASHLILSMKHHIQTQNLSKISSHNF